MQKSDIEIAQSCTLDKTETVAARAGIPQQALEPYGKYKAKIDVSALLPREKAAGRLVLVTAITPTPAGEGKTTTTIGLADALRRLVHPADEARDAPAAVVGQRDGRGVSRAEQQPVEQRLHGERLTGL